MSYTTPISDRVIEWPDPQPLVFRACNLIFLINRCRPKSAPEIAGIPAMADEYEDVCTWTRNGWRVDLSLSHSGTGFLFWTPPQPAGEIVGYGLDKDGCLMREIKDSNDPEADIEKMPGWPEEEL